MDRLEQARETLEIICEAHPDIFDESIEEGEAALGALATGEAKLVQTDPHNPQILDIQYKDPQKS